MCGKSEEFGHKKNPDRGSTDPKNIFAQQIFNCLYKHNSFISNPIIYLVLMVMIQRNSTLKIYFLFLHTYLFFPISFGTVFY